MNFLVDAVRLDGLASVAADSLLVVLAAAGPLADVDAAVSAHVETAIALGDFSFEAGRVMTVLSPASMTAKRLVVVAAGGGRVVQARQAIDIGLAELRQRAVGSVAATWVGFEPCLTEQLAEQLARATSEAAYLYTRTKPSAKPTFHATSVALLVPPEATEQAGRGLRLGQAIAAGISTAVDCGNLPANVATPDYLATEAVNLGAQFGFSVEVFDRSAIEVLRMGSFLAVAQGSAEEPRFIVIRYQGAPDAEPPVVLVGKGITFDTGGVSMKLPERMDEMKFDMCGAASILGTFRAVGELRPRINLVGLVAACENMVNGRALKPGDVVTSMSGQTIEVLNTDAEGRLILCDALTYAERFEPKSVVDVATLTFAGQIALGSVRSGMYATDDALAQALFDAGEAAFDPCWRMPLDDGYAEGLQSNFADVANVAGREGGAIIAAKFLERFAGRFKWGHLDILGVAYRTGANKGSTGRPVALLTHFVLGQAA